MAPGGSDYRGAGWSEKPDPRKIVWRDFCMDSPTGESEIVVTADGRRYRVVMRDAPNIIRNGRVEQ